MKKAVFVILFLAGKFCYAQEPGKLLFNTYCNFCHNGAVKEAPLFASLSMLSRESIAKSLESGVMKMQAAGLSKKEKKQIIGYISSVSQNQQFAQSGKCLDSALNWEEDVKIANWGMGPYNDRFIENNIGIKRENIKNLEMKWVFAFPDASRARCQPTIAGNTLYTADQNGLVYALDINSGCIKWTFKAEAEVRSAIVISESGKGKSDKIYFGDFKANVYALDLKTRKLIWKKKVDDHELATITGTLSIHEGKLYIPVSSTEVASAMNSEYNCCTFRGSVVALDESDGALIWKTYTTEPAVKNVSLKSKMGPSGAPVWSSPTIDSERNVLYIGTGENYSLPATETSDAIIAIDILTGKIKWVRQTIANDAWNAACPDKENCPENFGPDYDFGAPPILIKNETLGDILIAGQKSGMVFGIRPDDGLPVWSTRVGRGGIMGGVHWGMATDGKQIFVPINDHSVYEKDKDKISMAGLHALSIWTGEIIWSSLEKDRCLPNLNWQCAPGLSAAVTVVPGLVFGGALDGIIHAYDTANGKVCWEFDTNREFVSTTGVKCNGGSIDSTGPVIIGEKMFVNSGYAKFGEKAGNVLICFELN